MRGLLTTAIKDMVEVEEDVEKWIEEGEDKGYLGVVRRQERKKVIKEVRKKI